MVLSLYVAMVLPWILGSLAVWRCRLVRLVNFEFVSVATPRAATGTRIARFHVAAWLKC